MTNLSLRVLTALVALSLPLLTACGGDAESSSTGGDTGTSAVAIPATLFVADAPAGAVDIAAAVKSAKAGEKIVIKGVIGGRKKAFVEDRAMFVAIDASMDACSEDEGCPTPWDFCCDTPETIAANTLTVQVVDAAGAPLATSLKGSNGLKELDTVIVVGKVRSADGSVVVDAEQIHKVGG